MHLSRETEMEPIQKKEKEKGTAYYLSVRRVILIDLLLSLAVGAILFLTDLSISMARQVSINIDHTENTIQALETLDENDVILNDIIRESYLQRTTFVLYEYESKRNNPTEMNQEYLMDSLLIPFQNLKAAIIDRNGNVVAQTRSFQKTGFLTKIDKESWEPFVEEPTYDSLTDSVFLTHCGRRIDNDSWIVFQYSFESLLKELNHEEDYEQLFVTKTTDHLSALLVDQNEEIVFAKDQSLIGKKIHEVFGNEQNQYLSESDRFDLGIHAGKGKLYFSSRTVYERTGRYIYSISDLSPVISSSATQALLVTVFFFCILILESTYVYYNRQYRSVGVTDSSYTPSAIRYKTLIIGFIGLLAVGGFVYYIDTLSSISTLITGADQEISLLQATIQEMHNEQDHYLNTSKNQFLETTQILAGYIFENPSCRNRTEISKISDSFNLERVVVFDMDGKEMYGSGTLTNLVLEDITASEENTENVIHFTDLQKGRPYLTGDVIKDPWGSGYVLPVGVLLTDEENNPYGILQAVFRADKQKQAIEHSDISYIISERVNNGINSFIVLNPENRTIVHCPEKDTIGTSLEDYDGYREEMLNPYYTGKVNLAYNSYYATNRKMDPYLVFVGQPYNNAFLGRTEITLTAVLFSVLCFCICLFVMRAKHGKKTTVYCARNDTIVVNPKLIDIYYNSDRDQNIFSISPRKKRTSASDFRQEWKEMLPEEKVSSIIHLLVAVAAFFMVLFYLKSENFRSVITYSMSISHGSGINVFSVTSVLVTIVCGTILVTVIVLVLNLLSQLMQPRGETFCRLMSSTIKLFSVLLILYICLLRLGFDIRALVASVGIMGLVIGMGAKDLITDILAGLFIIFEGDFQVGDIVEVNGFMGMVKEIGIRTTKIVSWTKNVKIINNRNLSSVLNMTNRNSYAITSFLVPNTVDINFLAETLNRELKEIRPQYPMILKDPVFLGIHALEKGTMLCRVQAEVAERYRGETEDLLNWKIKEILQRNNIPLA